MPPGSVNGNLVGRLIGKPVGKLMGKSMGKSMGSPVGKLMGNPVGRLIGKSIGKSKGKPVGNPVVTCQRIQEQQLLPSGYIMTHIVPDYGNGSALNHGPEDKGSPEDLGNHVC
ncbi:hypothetical protein MCOR25_000774 [Pyricularia grisea]|nr:hypothetical protein MCOR25_000774 [Pyricularia grisea]